MASKLMFWTKIYLTNQFWYNQNKKENIKLVFSLRKTIVIAHRVSKRVLYFKVFKPVRLSAVKVCSYKCKENVDRLKVKQLAYR